MAQSNCGQEHSAESPVLLKLDTRQAIEAKRSAARPVPIGTKPDGRRLEPHHGRYAVLRADDRQYLYVPEIQELFSLDEELARLLGAAQVDAASLANGEVMPAVSIAAYQFVSLLIERNQTSPLSERRWQHTGLRDVVIHVSQVCNLNCVYCYAVDLNKANRTMTRETADRVIAHTMRLAPDGLACVKFLGGEPTVAWPIIEHLMQEYTAASSAASIKSPGYTMVTNGTLVTPEMVESAARHKMYVLVSIDGPKDIHDALRPYRGGAGSYDKATKALRAMVEAGIDVAVEAVYTRQHYLAGITPQSMIDHFLGLGVREFHIPPAIGAWHGAEVFSELAQVTEGYSEAVRNSIRSYRTDSPHLLRGIQFVLDGFAIRERRRHVCGAGRTFMGINYDGEAFPCYLLQSPEVSYGFVGDGWDDERYERIRSQFARNGKEYHAVCRECWANEICQSCLGASWELSPEITKPPAWFCGFQKALIGVVLAEVGNARESGDWPTFVTNWKKHLAPLADCGE
jgi:uncharacterized protein